MCKGVSASKHQSDVDRVRALLAQEDLYTKEPTSIQDSRVLGLQISKVGDELFWRRRVDITDFLEFDDRICSDEAVTYQDCSSFLGQLSSLLPVLSWLRPVTALGKRIVGSAAGTTKSSWRRLANESSKRFCRYICTLLRKLGDPGRGVWAVPPRSEALHCFVDASELALGIAICDTRNRPLEDECHLRPVDVTISNKPSLHINIAELDSTILGLQKCLAFGHKSIVLYTDSKSVAGWLQLLLDHQRIRPQGLYKALVCRRLRIIQSMVVENDLILRCIWIPTTSNLADVLTRLPSVARVTIPVEISPPFSVVAAELQLGGEEGVSRFWPTKDELLAVNSSVSRPFIDKGVTESDEGLLYYKGLLYLPVVFRAKLVRGVHLSLLHAGSADVESVIKLIYNWPRMSDDIR
ncbi:hypothetical protein FOZ63_006793, partial [Perkinsus olseni]